MIERIENMPAGTVGLRGSGKLTKGDYVDVLEPALREAIESGEARVLFALPDFDGLETGAWLEDLKTGLDVEFRNRSRWKRFAFVTDVDWVAKATRMFAWLIPGELKVCPMDELDEAKSWVAG